MSHSWFSDGSQISCLPDDAATALLVGRLWMPGTGPVLVGVHRGQLRDLSDVSLTCSELLAQSDPAAVVRDALRHAPVVAELGAVLRNAPQASRRPDLPFLLAPCDLQVIKASGVTFVASLLERVVEEQARGDAGRAEGLRQELMAAMGGALSEVRPGSAQARKIKDLLLARGLWSQYLEVGIGPDAEIFTKAPVLSAVGTGDDVGLHPRSRWNNSEPEVVLAVSPEGRIVGAALGNDLNLRDFEGRSALLLGKAKDNNASCAIGPFIRLMDDGFGLEDVRRCQINLRVQGPDGFELTDSGSMSLISRDPQDLVQQAMGDHHQYPDGMMMFLGTMLAPTVDRLGAGSGFTHQEGDWVGISSARLGTLVNRVQRSDRAPPWVFGIGSLMRSLATRPRRSSNPRLPG
ncbi:MAG: fumarylacetoacetate hydrolase family protein [Rhodoferax sp.]|nr:fumarylacetoacetate hydrolase family protein [Rhodoferax sp.]